MDKVGRILVDDGFSEVTARKLSSCNVLANFGRFVAAVIEAAADHHQKTHTEPAIGKLPSSTNENSTEVRSKLFRQDDCSANDKLAALHSVARFVQTAIARELLLMLTSRRPDNLGGEAAADIVRTLASSLVILISQSPKLIATLPGKTRRSVSALIDVVRAKYANEVRKLLQDQYADADRVVVFDPTCVVSVACLELIDPVWEVLSELRGAASDFKHAIEEYEQLFKENRARSPNKDFVVPPRNKDSWPGTIPELESFVGVLIKSPANEVLQRDETHLTMRMASKEVVGILLPDHACSPDAFGIGWQKLDKMRRDRLLVWMTFPSTRGGYFTGSGYGRVTTHLNQLLKEHKESKGWRKRAKQAAEGVVGGALATPVALAILGSFGVVASPIAVGLIAGLATPILKAWASDLIAAERS
jgi:hypothetical protein